MGKDKQQETLKALRQAVWEKAIGNTEITPGSYYWKKIGQAIEDTLGNSHPLHPDTIRNFFKGRHYPRPDTLDIFSRYVLGDAGKPKTFADFCNEAAAISENTTPALLQVEGVIHWKIGALAGAVVGFLAVVFVLLFRNVLGYHHVEDPYDFFLMVPGLLLTQMTAGAGLGAMILYWVNMEPEKWQSSKAQIQSLLLPPVWVMLAQQVAARDAWILPLGKEGRGGPLGEPNFETLATGMACLVGVQLMLHYFRHPVAHPLRFFQVSVVAIGAGLGYGCIFLLFRSLMALGWIEESGYFLSHAFFTYEFPNPQRIILVVLMFSGFGFLVLALKKRRPPPATKSSLMDSGG